MSASGFGDDDKLPKSGGTMSGTLTLAGSPPLVVPAGAGAGYVWTSDSGGSGSWGPATAGMGVFNVRNYGATGNGVTVDKTAVQNTVAAAIAAGGGVVYFPPGTYVMSNVTFGSNLIIAGSGKGNTILLMDPAAVSGAVVCRVAPPSSITPTTSCVVRDLTIDGNKAAWGSSSDQKGYGYYLGQSTNGLITHCAMREVEIRNCMTYAFDVEKAQYITLIDCDAHDNGYAAGTGAHVNADGFTLIGDDQTAIGCRAWNNAVYGFRAGQSGATWHRVQMIGCEAWGNGQVGASMGADSTPGDALYNSSILGGSFYTNGTAGIYVLAGAVSCTVTGASSYNNGTNGILVSGASYCSVTGNTVYGNATAGAANPEIYLTATSLHNAVTGNTVNGTTATNAIKEQNSSTDYTVVTGNNVTSAGTTISLAGTHSAAANNVGYSAAGGTPAASVNYKPSNPASTTSATLVMMGLGTTCTFTPNSTGIIMIAVNCGVGVSTAVANITVGPRYGTGTAPANGAAVSGTRFGPAADAIVRPTTFSVSSAVSQFGTTDVITGLTPGTAYWFDLALLTGTSPTDAAFLTGVSVSITELAA